MAINLDAVAEVRNAALSCTPISLGVRRTTSPHEFYRYPGRFSPELAAAIIAAFSRPGDLVADYFVGGGTTLVEARRAGRLAIGSDINSLSVFVSKVKTRTYRRDELDQVLAWSEAMPEWTLDACGFRLDKAAIGCFRNMTADELVPQRDLLLRGVSALDNVASRNARALARCVLLRTAQWAFDLRQDIPNIAQLRDALVENARATVATAQGITREYRAADARGSAYGLPRSLVMHQGLPGVTAHPLLRRHPAPQLVLTSPPYPGVYVNYHRWKLRGRLETPFPYLLAGQSDGNGLAYYTMAARSDPSLHTYFAKLESAFRDVARMCHRDTCLVQVVGFSDVKDQLKRYLATMNRAGFAEIKLDALATGDDGRLWRDVPGRRWWARAGARTTVVAHTSREVVLVHKPS